MPFYGSGAWHTPTVKPFQCAGCGSRQRITHRVRGLVCAYCGSDAPPQYDDADDIVRAFPAVSIANLYGRQTLQAEMRVV